METATTKKEKIILIVIGILASVISFVYYHALKCPNTIFLILVCLVDLFLFFISSFKIALTFNKGKCLTIIFSILIMIAFCLLIELIVFSFTIGTEIAYSLNLFFNVLLICLFLSPNLIILLPIVIFIADYA